MNGPIVTPPQGTPPPDAESVAPGFWLRAGAFMIDLILFGPVQFALRSSGVPHPVIATMILMAAYYTWMPMACSGQTLGKMAAGIAIIRRGGGELSYGRCFVRGIAYYLSEITFGSGFLMAAFTAERRALHDFVAGTRVVAVKDIGKGRRLLVAAAGALLTFALVLGIAGAFVIPVLGSRLNPRRAAASPQESSPGLEQACRLSKQDEERLKQFRPPLYQEPRILGAYLPPWTQKGNAGEDLVAAVELVLNASAFNPTDSSWDYAPAVAKVEEALKKEDFAITGTLFVPHTYAKVQKEIVFCTYLSKFGPIFSARIKRYLDAGQPAQALAEAKKGATLGFLMMHDWHTVTQGLGASLATGSLLLALKPTMQLGSDCAAGRLQIAEMVEEIKAYMPQPAELAKIRSFSAAPNSLDSLKPYLENPIMRSRYAEHVLISVVESLTAQEFQQKRIDPQRSAFMAWAASLDDKRLAILARGYTDVMNDRLNSGASASR